MLFKNDQLKQIVDQNPHFTTKDNERNRFRKIKKKIGYVSKLDVWVPHQLTGAQLTHRISACDLLLKRLKKRPFFDKHYYWG